MNQIEKSTPVRLDNPHLNLTNDFLYHLGLSAKDDLTGRFRCIKFICVGGKSKRMRKFAELLYQELGEPSDCEFEDSDGNGRKLKDISASAGRYSLFKVGPCLSASHGVGSASMSVVLHELLKMVYYAGCTDVSVIRMGTSGGLGIDPGTVVVTNQAYNGLLEPCFRQIVCGREIKYNTKTNSELTEKIISCAQAINVKTVVGNTMAADDFYEEQGRLDGALCSFDQKEKMEFLRRAHEDHGIVNMEMESACFTAMCNRTNVKCAVICACVINRLLGDQIKSNRSDLQEWENYPLKILVELIKLGM